jgi:hypothetical protein
MPWKRGCIWRRLPGITGVFGLLASGRPAGLAPVALRAGRAASRIGHRHHDRSRRRARRSQAAGIVRHLLAARRGERNQLLFWASLRAGELAADGDLDARTAAQALTDAAAQIGLADEDGPRAIAATIRSGFHRAGAAYEPP